MSLVSLVWAFSVTLHLRNSQGCWVSVLRLFEVGVVRPHSLGLGLPTSIAWLGSGFSQPLSFAAPRLRCHRGSTSGLFWLTLTVGLTACQCQVSLPWVPTHLVPCLFLVCVRRGVLGSPFLWSGKVLCVSPLVCVLRSCRLEGCLGVFVVRLHVVGLSAGGCVCGCFAFKFIVLIYYQIIHGLP